MNAVWSPAPPHRRGILVVALLFRTRGARPQAIRRIVLLVFAVVAVGSILFPDVWNRGVRWSGSAAASTSCSTA